MKKVSHTHHLLRCTRTDGSVEEVELETKSLLVHDLTHLAFEQERGLQKSFWGLVASGTTFDELRGVMDPGAEKAFSELVETETMVGPLQSVMLGRIGVRDFLPKLRDAREAQGENLPAYMTEDFVKQVVQRFTGFYGYWQSLAFGSVMTVQWD